MRWQDRNIVLIGMPGSGKTSVGKILASRLRRDFYDVDHWIESGEGETIGEIFLKRGEEYFRRLESVAVKTLSEKTGIIIATGGGVVTRGENIDKLKRTGIVFFINRPIEDIARDIDSSTRPLLSDDTHRIFALFEERRRLYEDSCDFEVRGLGDVCDTVEDVVRIFRRVEE